MTESIETMKQLEKDFGLARRRIYEVLDDEFKREYRKLTTDFGGEDESESPQSGHLTQTTQIVDKGFKGVKGIMTGRSVEQMLVSELEKLNIELERKVWFKRPYKYLRHSLQNNVRQRHNQKRPYDRVTQMLTYLL